MACGAFSQDCAIWDCRGGVLTIDRQPVGPLVSTAAITTSTGINHVGSGRFSLRCCTFRRTHTSADPIRILLIRLASTLTLSRPPGFASCARLMVCVSPWALRLMGGGSCDCMFWDDRRGGLTGQPTDPQVDTAKIRTVLSINHVDSRSFSSRLGVPAYTSERRPYSATWYPTSFTRDSLPCPQDLCPAQNSWLMLHLVP